MTGYVRVRVPVAGLRELPVHAAPAPGRDPMQESQLLFNEVLAVRREQGEWLAVEALEQEKCVSGTWQGYPGWVQEKDVAPCDGPGMYNCVVQAAFTVVRATPSAEGAAIFPLSLGTRLLLTEKARGFAGFAVEGGKTGWVAKGDVASMPAGGPVAGAEVAGLARLFVGTPYLWGGRSMPVPWAAGPPMGVDCSGLVNLAFRAVGIDVPRNAQDQCKKAAPIEAGALKAGDLVFLAKSGGADPISHVLLYLGGGELIEAAETGRAVCIRMLSQGLGADLEGLAEGRAPGAVKKIYFGRIV
jgi:cell wall-associated NlpC family hydrolase